MPKVSAVLIIVVSVLLGIGLIVLASASGVMGIQHHGDSQFFINRQIIWLLVAILAGIITAEFDYHWWQKWAVPISLFSRLLLVIVLIPGIGSKIGGSRRWLHLGSVSIQPSELGKFAVVISISSWIASIGRRVTRYPEGLAVPLGILGIFVLLIFAEPDYGTTILVATVGVIIMFVGGTLLSYLAPIVAVGFGVICFFISQNKLRLERVKAFIDPNASPDIAHQLNQSKISFMHGGVWGVGYGNSAQKQLFLPEAHTDFIFAILGEELGLIMSLIVVVLFIIILICGIIISIRAVDMFGRLLGFGVTFLVAMQAVINMGVVTGCLPTKGIALPLISYDGSSLIISVALVCVLLNISSHTLKGGDQHSPSVIKDRIHRV